MCWVHCRLCLCGVHTYAEQRQAIIGDDHISRQAQLLALNVGEQVYVVGAVEGWPLGEHFEQDGAH